MNIGQPNGEIEKIEGPQINPVAYPRLYPYLISFSPIEFRLLALNPGAVLRQLTVEKVTITLKITFNLTKFESFPNKSALCGAQLITGNDMRSIGYGYIPTTNGSISAIQGYTNIKTSAEYMDYDLSADNRCLKLTFSPTYVLKPERLTYNGSDLVRMAYKFRASIPSIMVLLPDANGEASDILLEKQVRVLGNIPNSLDMNDKYLTYTQFDMDVLSSDAVSELDKCDIQLNLKSEIYPSINTYPGHKDSIGKDFLGFEYQTSTTTKDGADQLVNQVGFLQEGHSLPHNNHSGSENGIKYYSTGPSSKVSDDIKKKNFQGLINIINKLTRRKQHENK